MVTIASQCRSSLKKLYKTVFSAHNLTVSTMAAFSNSTDDLFSTSAYDECLDDPRSQVPIIMMCLGGAIHFLICLALFWRCARGRYGSSSSVLNEYNLLHPNNTNNHNMTYSQQYASDQIGIYHFLSLCPSVSLYIEHIERGRRERECVQSTVPQGDEICDSNFLFPVGRLPNGAGLH